MAPKRIDLRKKIPTLQRIGVGVQSFYNYSHEWRGRLHGHDILEMNLVLRGEALHRIGEEEFTARVGDLGVVQYGERHELVSEEVDLFNIYLDPQNHALPELPAPMSETLAMLLPLHPNMGHRHNRVVTLHLDPVEPVAKLLCLMEEEQKREAPAGDQAMLAYLQVFLIHCGRAIQKGGIEMPMASSGYEMLERARQALEADLIHPPTLKELARDVGCSPNYFCTRFREYTGLPPQQYVLNRRLHRAMALLRSTDDKVLSIAYDSGFKDLAYFNRKFKQTTGKTPREYRRQFSM